MFVTLDAHTPNELNSQPFVQLTNYTAEGLEGGRLNRDFRSFLAIVHQPNIRDEIERFLRDEMVPEQIYARLCVKMGICTSSIASIDL